MKRLPTIFILTLILFLAIPKSSEAQSEKPTEIELAEGGISLADLFESMNDYADKLVIVRGKIVKLNNNIMGKNWIHIQDGTAYSGENDLTITSDVEVKVNVDDIVTFKGIITLNKDVGAGYFYKIIMEEAKIIE